MAAALDIDLPRITFADIAAAHARIAPNIVRTPTIHSHALSRLTGAHLSLKLENLQAIGSFKERGAANRLALMTEAERARGVIAVSAGNHAQGVARHASLLGIDATIVMPSQTPVAKVARTRSWGARVVLAGETLAEAFAHADAIQAREGRVFVHPFDDPAIMAGQGTFCVELLEDAGPLDTLVIPIGGAGLISGCAVAAAHLAPDLEIIGVQVETYASMQAHPGLPGNVRGGGTIAEGIAVASPGVHCVGALRERLSRVFVVTELEVESAITTLAEGAKQVAEGAAAAALAAIIAHPDYFRGRRIAMPITGGNIGSRILANTLLRSLHRDGRLLRLVLEIPDRPGILADIAATIGGVGGNIIEVGHQRLFAAPSVQTADLELMIEARDAAHAHEIEDLLGARYRVRRG